MKNKLVITLVLVLLSTASLGSIGIAMESFILVYKSGGEIKEIDFSVGYQESSYPELGGSFDQYVQVELKDFVRYSLYSYPYTEIISIDGEPWQETKWKDTIIASVDTVLKADDGLRKNPLLREVFLNPEHNGNALEAYEKLEDENAPIVRVHLGTNKVIVIKDGVENIKLIDVVVETVDGRTMVPLRGVLEEYGVTFGYDDATRIVTAKQGTTNIQLTLDKKEALVNNTNVTLDVPAIAKSGRTLVPFRFLAENLGYYVSYDSQTKVVTVQGR